MAENGNSKNIKFYKPKRRFVIPIESFHIPKRLYKEYKKENFVFCINKKFLSVINNCTIKRKKEKDTWINQIIIDTYFELYKKGYAKSIECFYNEKLVGGLYGIHIGSCFFGESMFSKMNNTSKLCLLFLISILKKNKYILLDSQFLNPHLIQFGGYEISDAEYQIKLNKAINRKNIFPESFDIKNSIYILQSLSHKS